MAQPQDGEGPSPNKKNRNPFSGIAVDICKKQAPGFMSVSFGLEIAG